MLTQNQVEHFNLILPPDYIRAAEVGIENLEPWHWLDIEKCHARRIGLIKRYPMRELIPFSERQDCDDVACWDLASPNKVFIIHDFAASAWETKAIYNDFREWFHQALEDCLNFI